MKNIKSAWLSRLSKGNSWKGVNLELPAQCLANITSVGTMCTAKKIIEEMVLVLLIVTFKVEKSLSESLEWYMTNSQTKLWL